jgi:hypothetical protein
MTSSSSYNSNSQSNEFKTTNFSQANSFVETMAKLNGKEKALLEEVKLNEWRNNLKLVRERNIR